MSAPSSPMALPGLSTTGSPVTHIPAPPSYPADSSQAPAAVGYVLPSPQLLIRPLSPLETSMTANKRASGGVGVEDRSISWETSTSMAKGGENVGREEAGLLAPPSPVYSRPRGVEDSASTRHSTAGRTPSCSGSPRASFHASHGRSPRHGSIPRHAPVVFADEIRLCAANRSISGERRAAAILENDHENAWDPGTISAVSRSPSTRPLLGGACIIDAYI